MQKMRLQGFKAKIKGKKSKVILLYHFLEIIRPYTSLGALFGVLIGAVLSGFYSSPGIILACASVFLITGAGNTINDYFDYKVDKINKSHRPIPSGRINRKTALFFSLSLFLIGIIITYFLNYYMFLLAVLNSVLLIAYAWKIKSMPVGNFVVSWLTASTPLFGGLLINEMKPIILFLIIIIFLTNISREIMKSLEDIEADKIYHYNTLPIYLGESNSKTFAMLTGLIAVILTPLPYLWNIVGIYYIPFILIADLIFLYSFSRHPPEAQKLMKAAMFIAMFGFLAGIIL